MPAMRESALLNHIYQTAATTAGENVIPPGDDMGALNIAGRQVLVTVDQLADGVHADLATMPLQKVARKAVMRNLSDVAAMAATPCGAVVAATLPRDFGETRATDLFDAMRAAAAEFNCPLIGGDIGMWDHPLLLSVTVLAEPAGITPVLRQGAQPSDAIYVTGALGGSLETMDGYSHHLDFTPRLDLARTLAGNDSTRPHAMIDLSDGLGQDLPRLCHAGNVSASVDGSALPISAAAQQAAARTGQPPWQHAIGDGEDYQLLFTAAPNTIPHSLAGVTLHRIGTITKATDQPRATLILEDNTPLDLQAFGWEHHG
jgi:thiamine-monophosphate kinase